METTEAQQFAKEHGLLFFEASAKSFVNVKEAFTGVAHQVNLKVVNQIIDTNVEVV